MAMENEERKKRSAPTEMEDRHSVKRRELEEMSVYRIGTSSLAPPLLLTKDQRYVLKLLKRLLMSTAPLYFLLTPRYIFIYDTTRTSMDCILYHLGKTGYPVYELKAAIDEFFSLCTDSIAIKYKSHKEICQCSYDNQLNTVKELVAQFQATHRFNALPRELIIDILARVLLELVAEKITASMDNILSLLPNEIQGIYMLHYLQF
ncbi:hypothetical protein AAC387_Pa07g3679 [Persea americana]